VKQAGNLVAVYDIAAVTSVGTNALIITTTTSAFDDSGNLTSQVGQYSIPLGVYEDDPFVSWAVSSTVIDCVEQYSLYSVDLCTTLSNLENCNVTGTVVLCPAPVTNLISCCNAPTASVASVSAWSTAPVTSTVVLSPLLSGVFTSTSTSANLVDPSTSTTVTVGTISIADEQQDICTRTVTAEAVYSSSVFFQSSATVEEYTSSSLTIEAVCQQSVVVTPNAPINGTTSMTICAGVGPVLSCAAGITNNVGDVFCTQVAIPDAGQLYILNAKGVSKAAENAVKAEKGKPQEKKIQPDVTVSKSTTSSPPLNKDAKNGRKNAAVKN